MYEYINIFCGGAQLVLLVTESEIHARAPSCLMPAGGASYQRVYQTRERCDQMCDS